MTTSHPQPPGCHLHVVTDALLGARISPALWGEGPLACVLLGLHPQGLGLSLSAGRTWRRVVASRYTGGLGLSASGAAPRPRNLWALRCVEV